MTNHDHLFALVCQAADLSDSPDATLQRAARAYLNIKLLTREMRSEPLPTDGTSWLTPPLSQ